MNTQHAGRNESLPARVPAQGGSRGIRFVAAGVLTLAANALWLRAEVVDAVGSVSYADCWFILLWTLLSAGVACWMGFGLTFWLGRWVKPSVLALLVMGVLVAVCWQQWALLVPG